MVGPERLQPSRESSAGTIPSNDFSFASSESLYRYIVENLKSIEDAKYPNTAEHKLLFLVGGPKNDVAAAMTSTGQPAYDQPHDHPKLPEVTEANAAISQYFEKGRNPAYYPGVLSEIADIYFNLALLTKLDPEATLLYRRSIGHLTDSLQIYLRDGLLLAATKYDLRLVVNRSKKNTQAEERAMAKLSDADGRMPEVFIRDRGLARGYGALNEIAYHVLMPRLIQIQSTRGWNNIDWNF